VHIERNYQLVAADMVQMGEEIKTISSSANITKHLLNTSHLFTKIE